MTVAYSSIATVAYSAKVNTTCNKPTVSVGHMMVGYLIHGGASIPSVTPPSGWTEFTTTTFTTVTQSGGAFNLKLRVWYRLVDGSEGANFQWTHVSASTTMAIVNYTGVDTTTPIGPVSQNSGTGVTSTYATLTPTAGGCITTIGIDWADNAANLSAPSGTPTLTERYDGTILYVATADNVSGTATGTRTQAQNSGASSPWGAYQLSINPAGAAAAIANKKLIIEKQALVRASYW